MPRLSNGRIPKYRKHRASGQAVCTIGGRDHYLGPHGSKASRVEYDRLTGQWLAAGRPAQWPPPAEYEITVAELLVRYLTFVKRHYSQGPKPSRYVDDIKPAVKMLRETYGRTAAAEFGPLALKALRERMIAAGWSRKYVNENVDRIRRVFKWGTGEELVPPSVFHGLQAVEGLRKGRTEAPEGKPVLPVAEADVQEVLPHLPEVVSDMVRFERLTGARPAEVCSLRPCDVDRSGTIWLYRPAEHKTEHHGRERVVFVGPKAQAILAPYLLRAADAYCFAPVDSERKRRADQHAKRKTPLSCGNRPGSNRVRRRRRPPGDRYQTDTYRRAIHRACDKAGISRWSPNRLRHSAATEIRSRFGLEAAQVILGHSKADVTQVYAERDIAKGVEVARAIG